MFKIFKKKTDLEKLNEQYTKLREEAYQLSTKDRKASDGKIAESEVIMQRINELVK